MGYSDTELHRRLTENPEEAKSIGFEEVPSRTTFGRTWQNRMDEELRIQVQHITHRILEYAHENGNPIGLHSLEPDEKDDVSERTESRVIREKSLKAAKDLRKLLYGAIDLQRPDTGTEYATSEFLGMESLMCSETCAAEQGSEIYGDHAPKGVSVPDADTLLHYVKRLDIEEVFDVIHQGISVQLKTARRHLEFTRPVEIAIDMTYVAYYGQRDESLNIGEDNDRVVVMGAPPTKGYDWCFKFATLTVVGDNVKLTLAVKPVQKGEELVGEIVRELVQKAREHVDIRMVFADREFCTVETMRLLDEFGVHYTIPAPKRQRIKREVERMREDVKVIEDWVRYGPVSDGRSNQPVRTNLILLPSTKDPENTVAFTTNQPLESKQEAKGQVNRYARRWGIENSYKTIKDFLAWTTSKEFVVRLFYFGFAVLLYTMWLLVDLLVQISLDVEHRYKPRVTAKRFLNLVRKQLAEPG
jgi:IS4 transposase